MNFITGDTHGEVMNLIQRIKLCSIKGGNRLFIAGDFGFIRETNKREIYKEDRRLEHINDYAESKGIEILFIDGNHENFNRLLKFPEIDLYGGKMGEIKHNILHLKRGYVYTIEGKKIFTMGGGISVDKSSRVENVSWWKEELHSLEEQNRAIDNLEAHQWKVDYVVTHSAPSQAKEMIKRAMKKAGIDNSRKFDVFNAESKFHSYIYNNLKFKEWHFGHYHQDHSEGNLNLHYIVTRKFY